MHNRIADHDLINNRWLMKKGFLLISIIDYEYCPILKPKIQCTSIILCKRHQQSWHENVQIIQICVHIHIRSIVTMETKSNFFLHVGSTQKKAVHATISNIKKLFIKSTLGRNHWWSVFLSYILNDEELTCKPLPNTKIARPVLLYK